MIFSRLSIIIFSMSWFVFALVSLLGWGSADLFYKKGTDEADRYSHLKIAVWVGLVMGVCSIILIFISGNSFAEGGVLTAGKLWENALKYSPASLCYIISMVIGYAGLRYLEMSIISPVQNASGALSSICMIIYFILVGKFASIGEAMTALDLAGIILIVAGVIALAVVERRLQGRDSGVEKKYRMGALALIFPILYCVFDTAGTAADGVILDENVGLGLSETDVLIVYGLTFLAAGIICWLIILIKTKKPYNPFAKSEIFKAIAAVCEEFGQIFYVYAMSANPVLASPVIGSYCIVSVIFGRIFAGEKLKASQYACVFVVIAGIIITGISEALAS